MGCDRRPSADTREWVAGDHDKGSAADQTNLANRAPKGTASPANDDAVMIETTWKMACAQCHGPMGRGDGPQGPMVQARDFTDPAFQRSVTDEGLAMSIKNGKGTKMPKFDLPDQLVKKLVARIRSLGPPMPSATPSVSATAAPLPSGSAKKP